MHYAILQEGVSRSFPSGDLFVAKAASVEEADVLFCLGTTPTPLAVNARAVAIELPDRVPCRSCRFRALPARERLWICAL